MALQTRFLEVLCRSGHWWLAQLVDNRIDLAQRHALANKFGEKKDHDLEPHFAAKLHRFIGKKGELLMTPKYQHSLTCWARAHDLINDDCEDAHARTRRGTTPSTLAETIARNYTLEEATLVMNNYKQGHCRRSELKATSESCKETRDESYHESMG